MAYTWEDNRNLRSWDIYFKLISLQTGITEYSENIFKLKKSTIFLKKENIRNIKNYFTSFDSLKIYDKKGNLVKPENLNNLTTGVYFLKDNSLKGAKKIIIF